jgi:tetratricopeptide (TPR) repeat protein
MTTQKIILVFLLIVLYSCGQNSAEYKVNKNAVNLNKNAMELVKYISNTDSAQKAINLLDSATGIDSNYYLGYFNKLMFLNNLKQYDKAISATKSLIKLRPNAHDLYILNGVFFEKVNDSISSKGCFEKSLAICNSVLGTMNLSNLDYEMIVINKAVNLIMLSKNAEANGLLNKFSKTQQEGKMKNITLSMINLSKKQLIELYYSGN